MTALIHSSDRAISQAGMDSLRRDAAGDAFDPEDIIVYAIDLAQDERQITECTVGHRLFHAGVGDTWADSHMQTGGRLHRRQCHG